MNYIKKASSYFEQSSVKPIQGNPSDLEKRYKYFRWQVFISATLGYALFYVCRLSISIVKKPLVDANLFTESEIGQIGSALFFSYAVGKLVNGFFSDSLNVNRFIAVGLLLTAACNLAMGAFPFFIVFFLLWGLNGWFQSFGASPCVVALTRWFETSERGTYYGIWSSSHNLGKAITFTTLPILIEMGGWRWGFCGAGAFGLLGFFIVKIFLHDSPQSVGLLPIQETKSTIDTKTQNEEEISVKDSQRELLKNPFIWIIALSSAFMYISRYAIESWGVFYSQAEKGYSNANAAELIGLTAITGIIGTVISGLISDKLFKSSRNIPALLAGILNILSIAVFLFADSKDGFVDAIAMLVHGFSIGILITFLGGLMAVDIASKKAAGAAMGLIGISSYIGAGMQELVSGFLISENKSVTAGIVSYDFTISKYFWFTSAVISVILAALVWKAKRK